MSLKLGYKQTEIEVIPDNWQTKTLGSLLDYEQPTPFLVISTDYLEFSSVPVLTAGKTFILGYTDEEHGVYKSLPVILFDDFTTACQWVDFPFKVKSSAAKILSGRVGVSDTKFMHEYLSRLSYVPSDHQRHWISVFSSIEVIVPPIKEQEAIAEALSDVDALINSLEALLTKKRNIKTGVMQELLTGRTRLPGFTGQVQEVSLKSFLTINKGNLITEKTASEGDIPVIAGGKTIAYFHNVPNRLKSTVTISGSGANAGYVAFHEYPIYASDCSTIEENESFHLKYVYFALLLKQNEIYRSQTGGAQPHIHPRNLYPLMVQLPKLKEQEAIANVLSDIDDEIEALEKRLAKTRDLKQGMAQELLTGRTRLV